MIHCVHGYGWISEHGNGYPRMSEFPWIPWVSMDVHGYIHHAAPAAGGASSDSSAGRSSASSAMAAGRGKTETGLSDNSSVCGAIWNDRVECPRLECPRLECPRGMKPPLASASAAAFSCQLTAAAEKCVARQMMNAIIVLYLVVLCIMQYKMHG